MKFEWWHAFVIGAMVSWGCYVPLLHEGQSLLGGGKPSAGAVRAFLCVGVAYFLTAVIIPLALLWTNQAGGERFDFTREGNFMSRAIFFATVAGVAGAAGALCIILSIKNGGKPLYIAPLVFAGAPIVNACVSLLWHPPKEGHPDWKFFLGIVLAAVGAGMVLYSKAQLDMKGKTAPPPVEAHASAK